MIFDTKDEKLEKLEKKIGDLEKRMSHNFDRINETIATLNEIIVHLQADNTKLRSEKDFLVERHKKMLRRVPVPDLSRDVREKLIRPTTNKIKENAALFSNAVTEGFVELKDPDNVKAKKKNPVKDLKDHVMREEHTSSGRTIDRLYEIVSESGRMRVDEAAKRLNVHEVQIEEWGKILQEHELITMKKNSLGRVELVKT